MKGFRFWHKLKKRRDGFTVIEMLVVLGVTSILISMFTGQAASLRDEITLFREESRLVQTILRAKTFSLQALELDSGYTACGYGVNLDSVGTYLVYAVRKDKNNQPECPKKSDISAWQYQKNNNKFEVIGSVYTIDKRITAGVYGIVFLPPRPEVVWTESSGTTDLCLPDSGFCREIKVSQAAQVTSGRKN